MNADQGKRVSRRGRRGAERRKHGQCGREGTAPQRIRRSRRKEEGTTDAHRWTQIAEAGHGQDERDRQDSEETAAVPSSFVIGHSSFRRGPTPPEHRASDRGVCPRITRITRKKTRCLAEAIWPIRQSSVGSRQSAVGRTQSLFHSTLAPLTLDPPAGPSFVIGHSSFRRSRTPLPRLCRRVARARFGASPPKSQYVKALRTLNVPGTASP